MQRIKNLIIITAMMAFAGTIYAQKITPDHRYEQDFQQAMDLYRKAKYAAAQYQFDQLVASQKSDRGIQSADAVYYAAVCSQMLGNGDTRYRLDEFLRLYPESSHANMVHFFQGNYHYDRAEYSLALQYYNQVEPTGIEYGHRDEFEYKCGYSQLNIGERDKAKASFSHIMNGKSKYKTNALYYYAHIQYLEQDYTQAQKNFNKLINDKKTPKSLVQICENYDVRIDYYLGNYDKFLQKAPSLMNDDGVFKKEDLQQMMGEVYFNRGEYREALRYYLQATAPVAPSKDKNMTVCVSNDNAYPIGYCYYMLGQYDSAAVYLQRKTSCNDTVSQNALYTLGDTYVRLGRKSEARSMFLQASKMNFDPKIKEDALFNYAKLSCELNQNAYNESIKSFEDYLNTYPKTKHKSEIQEILTSLYFTTRNYKDALTLIEREKRSNTLSAEMRLAYQRLLINRGIELFNGRNVKESAKYFQKAIRENADVQKTADACYLHGEANYRLGNFQQAKKALDKFFANTKAKQSPYYSQALYTYGYLCVQSEHYAEGVTRFSELLIRSDISPNQRCDIYNRLGDCQYGQKEFELAITDYTYVINHNGKDADYATYQKALACGVLGRNKDKLTYLDNIFERYPNSQYASKARFEIARTYLVWDNNEMALVSFQKFISDYPNSAYVKEALLNLGTIYYNIDQNDKAMEYLDRLLRNYQGTEEARDALSIVQHIYTDQNRIDEYFTYAQQVAKVSVSTRVQDSVTFTAALDRYYENDYNATITYLEKYLSKYPNGLSNLDAHFYLAESYYTKARTITPSDSQYTPTLRQALTHYEAVAHRNKNLRTETSLTNAADIATILQDYEGALDNYLRLVALSENDNSRLEARLGVLRCQNKLGRHENIMSAAQLLLNEAKLPPEMRDEALVSIARTCYNQQSLDSAAAYYAQLAKTDNGAFYGEAVYRNAEILYRKNNLASCEHAIDSIIDNPPSDFWLAKTFILWADIFYQQGNMLQAKQTLQSIIDNYVADGSSQGQGLESENLVDVALQKRNAILQAEAEAANPQQQQEEIQLTIPLDEE